MSTRITMLDGDCTEKMENGRIFWGEGTRMVSWWSERTGKPGYHARLEGVKNGEAWGGEEYGPCMTRQQAENKVLREYKHRTGKE